MNRLRAGQVAVAAILWGLWPLFIRPSGLSGPQCAVLTLAVMSAPAPFVFTRAALRNRPATAALIAVGVFDALNVGLYFSALQRGPVVVAVLTHYLAPLLVALAAPWVLGEGLSRRALYATPIILLGLGLVIGPASGEGLWITALLGAGSAVFFAALVLASKRAAAAYSPIAVTTLHAPISVVLLLLAFRGEAIPAALDAGTGRILGGAMVSGLFATTFFNTGLRGVPAHLAGVLTYLEPLVAALIGILIFNEVLQWTTALGAALVLIGGVWVALEKR